MLGTNTNRREEDALEARNDALLEKCSDSFRSMPMDLVVKAANGAGRPLIAYYENIGRLLDRGPREALRVEFMGKKKITQVYDALERLFEQHDGSSSTT